MRVIVDRFSLPYLEGSCVDYIDGLMGAGFQIENPNVVAACGCGSSFQAKDEVDCGRARCRRRLRHRLRLLALS